ncbi:hypothetical protein [Bradyrhizobium quebecense]|uniref:Uncharacterized protein n=2 Tax=Bradyrhizobium quebecense TaxID=2748629 RepID=A0ABS3MTK5_9BRAD|nr:hypothetical protein [Bradyrhizobium quebecense]UGY02628.1 hypothetical protein J4P68_0037065 [Bradyrhizobium quebecense]
MQPNFGILCGVLLVGFIVFAFRQGLKLSPDSSGKGTNSDNVDQGPGP